MCLFLMAAGGSSAGPQPFFQAPTSQRDTRFDDLAERALEAREAQRLEESIRFYQEALRLRPTWTEGWWYAGSLLYESKRFAEAGDAFARLLTLEPTGGPAWALLGLTEFQLGQYEQSLAALEKAITHGVGANPQLVSLTQYHAAVLLTRFGRFEESRKLLLALAKQSRQHSDVMGALGLSVLAIPRLPSELPAEKKDLALRSGQAAYYGALHRLEEARKEYRQLLEGYPQEPNVHYNYALFLQLEDPDAAIQAFQRVLEIWPSHVSARVLLAMEYLRRGDFTLARKLAQEAASLDPRSSEARRLLGQILLETGGISQAVEHLEAAVQLAPSNPQARYLLARAYARAGRPADAERERQAFSRLRGRP